VATLPAIRATCTPDYILKPCEPGLGDLVASWVRDEREAFWLAPKTWPPITGDDVRAWQRPGHEALVLASQLDGQAVAYGELNVLNAARGDYWLGHLLVDSARRGRGLGLELTRALLRWARTHYAARTVSLVVFPENVAAIRCYQAAGLREAGYESHNLTPYCRRTRLLRMAVTWSD
jgi:RimJ/RimL family protein N-acetyltransferase